MIEDIYKAYKQSSRVCIDTRKIIEGCIYVALKGEVFDGNEFVEAALSKGAAFAITSSLEFANSENCFVVEDTLRTLQDLACFHRKQFDIPFVGITGSNGKTTTKELLNAVLSTGFNVYATQGNFNNHIGVPLTLLSIQDDCEIAIVEMGANHVGEIAELCQIALPDFGLITNIGRAHLEGFGSYENIKKTKAGLYESVEDRGGLLFVNGDDDELLALSEDVRRVMYCTSNAGDLNYSVDNSGFTVGVTISGVTVKSSLFGRYNAQNIAAACLVGQYFGLTLEQMKLGIEGYVPSNNRSQVLKTAKNTVLLDAYNANPSSMEAAILNFAEAELENKVLVLGEMYELGIESEAEHAKIMALCNEQGLGHVFYIGNWPVDQKWATVAEFSDYLTQNPLQDANVLVKGSRGVRLEALVEHL